MGARRSLSASIVAKGAMLYLLALAFAGPACGGCSTGSGSTAIADAGVPDAPDDAALLAAARHTACVADSNQTCDAFRRCLPVLYTHDMKSFDWCVDRLAEQCERSVPGPGIAPEQITACDAARDFSTCDAFRTYSFDRIRPPACVFAGVEQSGEPCGSSSECSSTACDTAAYICGTCVDKVNVGDTCDVNDQCPPASSCVAAKCRALAPEGGACGALTPCSGFLSCIGGKCSRRATLGQGCASPDECEVDPEELWCNPITKACEHFAIAQNGAPCGTLPDGSRATCETGYDCRRNGNDTGACTPEVADGMPCLNVQYLFGGGCEWPAICFEGICQIFDVAACSAGFPP